MSSIQSASSKRTPFQSIARQGARVWIVTGLAVLLVLVTFFMGFFARELSSPEAFQFPLVRQAYLILQRRGIHTMPQQDQLQYGLIRGMIQAYGDPYTSFNEPAQAELQTDQLEGRFGGIGVRIERDSSGQVLLYPLPNSPALTAGIQDGDQLQSVEGMRVTPETSLDEIQAAIRGPVGQKVKLELIRAGQTTVLSVVVEREEVPVPSVTYNLASFDASLGIVQLNIVADTSADEISAAIEALTGQGGTRFILDLRNNGGGLVDAGAAITRLFLPVGDFLVEQFKGQEASTFTNEQAGAYSTLPLAVVVNHNTASAAEIIAGALQASGHIQLVGSVTYGKDSIQEVFQLQDGSNLHVSAGRWWLPSQPDGIGGSGLTPNVLLPDEATDGPQALEAAASLLSTR